MERRIRLLTAGPILACVVATSISLPARADPPAPQRFCDVAKSADMDATNLPWGEASDFGGYFFCVGGRQDSGGKDGKAILYAYRVEGGQTAVRTITIFADIFTERLPRAAIAKAVSPLLKGVFSVAAGAGVPPELAKAVKSVGAFRGETSVGLVTAAYEPGPDPEKPFTAARYTVRIALR